MDFDIRPFVALRLRRTVGNSDILAHGAGLAAEISSFSRKLARGTGLESTLGNVAGLACGALVALRCRHTIGNRDILTLPCPNGFGMKISKQ